MGAKRALVAVAARGRTGVLQDDVMVDPFGDEAAGFAEGGLGMVDSV